MATGGGQAVAIDQIWWQELSRMLLLLLLAMPDHARTLHRQTRIHEAGLAMLMIDKELLARLIHFGFPARRQLPPQLGERVHQCNQILVVLIALEALRISAYPHNHVLKCRIAIIDGQGRLIGVQQRVEVRTAEHQHSRMDGQIECIGR